MRCIHFVAWIGLLQCILGGVYCRDGIIRCCVFGQEGTLQSGSCRYCGQVDCVMPPTETMKAMAMPSTAAARVVVPVKPERKVAMNDEDPQVQQQKKASGRVEEEDGEMPTSPRVRRKLSNAQESASIFSMVCEQGEVIQWMTACHPDLTVFGVDLERRGYRTLSSIAFLTEEDVEGVANSELRQLLLTTLSRLRHELFRM